MRWNRVPLTCVAIAFAASSAALATGAETKQDTPAAAAVSPAAEPVVRKIPGTAQSMQGLVVVRDAETGEMRSPNAEEWAKLAPHVEPANRFAEGLEETYYADGTVGVRLGDSFHSFSMVQKGSNGHTHPACTTSAQAIVDLVTGAAPTPEVRDEQ